jgi:DNA-binding response OmpR family regulator
VKPRLCLVEDDPTIRELLSRRLVRAGYDVDVFADAKALLGRATVEPYALFLLDVLLDGEPAGLELCRRLRQLSPTVPILIVSALSEPAHRIEGLRDGADDYVTKPFEMEELLLRIEKILLRSAWLQRNVDGDRRFSWDGITVDFASLEANVRGTTIRLTLREGMLLRLLVELRGQVVSRDTILDRVWGGDAFPSTRTVDNFLVRLRRYFEPDPKTPRYFHSVRGMGYKFTPGSEHR